MKVELLAFLRHHLEDRLHFPVSISPHSRSCSGIFSANEPSLSTFKQQKSFKVGCWYAPGWLTAL